MSTERLKAQMMRKAVEDNVDTLRDRLPRRLRPWRRNLHLLWRGTLTIGVPVALILVVGGVGLPSARVSTPPAAADAGAAPARVMGTLDASVLSQRFPPDLLALSVRRVVIDAGHGGENLGTSSAGGLKEKDVALDIAGRLRQLVVARGFEAVMTRVGDETLSLQQRAAIANSSQGDIFVSIHLNSLGTPSARGIETYYLGPSTGATEDAVAALENHDSGYSMSDLRPLLERVFTDAKRSESRRLAHAVQQSLVEKLGATDPLVDRGVKMAPFVVLIATEMPAILAEVSCLSNSDEARRLGTPEYPQAIAEALAAGVTAFAEAGA